MSGDVTLAGRSVLVVPDEICDTGGATVSYVGRVQDFSSFFQDEDEMNVRLDRITTDALDHIRDVA